MACGWQEVSSALSHRPHPHLSYSDPCVLLIILSFLSYLVLESPSPNTLCAVGRFCFLEALQLRPRGPERMGLPSSWDPSSLESLFCFITTSESIPCATLECAECKVRHQKRASKPSHFLRHIQPTPHRPPPPPTHALSSVDNLLGPFKHHLKNSAVVLLVTRRLFLTYISSLNSYPLKKKNSYPCKPQKPELWLKELLTMVSYL